MDFEKILYGGDNENNIDENKIDENKIELVDKETSMMKEYFPIMTRDTLSIFEYVGVITKLAKYLSSLKSLDKYISEVEVNQIINPAELAFNLINDGKYDAILDRGYERVTFSKMKVKQQWKDMITNYFKEQHEVVQHEVLETLDIGE